MRLQQSRQCLSSSVCLPVSQPLRGSLLGVVTAVKIISVLGWVALCCVVLCCVVLCCVVLCCVW